MIGWTRARLDECCEVVGGATPSTSVDSYWDGDICWATPKDLSDLDGAFISDTPRKLTRAGLDACAASILPAGSVLFSSRAPIGLVAVNTVPMATNQGFKSFVPKEGRVEAKFLYWWLRSNRPYLENLGNGATFKEVSKAVVSRIEIPLPPFPEQQRIAEVLDQAEMLRAKRQAALAQLDSLAQAIFMDLFGDPATNPKEWPDSKSLGEISDIVSGVTKGRNLQGQSVREVPYMAVVNVQDRSLNLSTVKTIEATEDEIERYKLMPNDLLLTEGGDPDKLGRGTLWNNEIPECIHQNHIFRVRITTPDVHPLFLNWLVGSQRGKRFFLRSAKQTTGIASINMTQLRSFPMLFPPMTLQLDFAHRVGILEQLKDRHRASLAEMNSLFATLQDRAFRGEL